MVCTYCGSKTSVTNSRLQKRSNNVWRRRQCKACGAIFSTLEQVDYEKTWVVQYSDGTLSPFMRDKLLLSIYKASQHRPTAMHDAIGLTDTIISKLDTDIENGSLQIKDLTKAAHTVLRRFDQPAAISYQAFHADVL
jgi:transcriptional regulator NrdR family protein